MSLALLDHSPYRADETRLPSLWIVIMIHWTMRIMVSGLARDPQPVAVYTYHIHIQSDICRFQNPYFIQISRKVSKQI
jgi:hypothetical protein